MGREDKSSDIMHSSCKHAHEHIRITQHGHLDRFCSGWLSSFRFFPSVYSSKSAFQRILFLLCLEWRCYHAGYGHGRHPSLCHALNWAVVGANYRWWCYHLGFMNKSSSGIKWYTRWVWHNHVAMGEYFQGQRLTLVSYIFSELSLCWWNPIFSQSVKKHPLMLVC